MELGGILENFENYLEATKSSGILNLAILAFLLKCTLNFVKCMANQLINRIAKFSMH